MSEPVDIIGDLLCRTSFGDFSEERLRKVAAQIVGVLHREGFYIASEEMPSSEAFDEADGMCPNCVTPWKCNGPHLTDQTPRALHQAAPSSKQVAQPAETPGE